MRGGDEKVGWPGGGPGSGMPEVGREGGRERATNRALTVPLPTSFAGGTRRDPSHV